MPGEHPITVRGKDLLPALLLLQILPLSITMIAFLAAPGLKPLFVDVLGSEADLPFLTDVLLHSYRLWFLIPLVLTVLSFLACRKPRTIAPPMVVFAATIVLSGLLSIILVCGVLQPLLMLINQLET